MTDISQGFVGWGTRLQTCWERSLDFLFPRHCASCEGPVESSTGHLCEACLLAIHPVVEPFCSRCGDPVDGVADHGFQCSLCALSSPAFDLARSAARFRGPLRPLLHQFKYRDGAHLAGDLTRLLVACVETHYDPAQVDLAAFVPLYHRRERERSYNQARLLAERLGRRFGKPVLRGFKRIRNTGTQTRLHAMERAKNVKDAFYVTDPAWVEGKTILLVDDVMTTGATLREASLVLKQAGAWRVLVVTVARG